MVASSPACPPHAILAEVMCSMRAASWAASGSSPISQLRSIIMLPHHDIISSQGGTNEAPRTRIAGPGRHFHGANRTALSRQGNLLPDGDGGGAGHLARRLADRLHP